MFKELFTESYADHVQVEMECPNCFKGNIVSVAKSMNVRVDGVRGKEAVKKGLVTVSGDKKDVVEVLRKMGVDKDDLQIYIDHWKV